MSKGKKKYKAPKTRPFYIHLKSRWRNPYFVATTGQASAVHRISSDGYFLGDRTPSILRYYTEDGTYHPFIRSVCYPYSRIRFQTLNQEQAEALIAEGKFHWCAPCQRVKSPRRY